MTVWLEIIAFRPLPLAPPTTPCLVRCAFIQLCIQPHPRLIPPLRSYYYFSSARDLAPTTSFLAKPVDGRQRETKQGEPETRSSRLDIPPSSSSSSAPRRQIWTDAFVSSKNSPAGAGEGETWSLTSLCVGRSGWWKPRWTKSGEFASIRSKSLRFLSSSYRTGDDRSLFEIQSVGQDDREFMNEPVTQWSTYFLEIAFVARLKFWHSSANAKCARAKKGPRITI